VSPELQVRAHNSQEIGFVSLYFLVFVELCVVDIYAYEKPCSGRNRDIAIKKRNLMVWANIIWD